MRTRPITLLILSCALIASADVVYYACCSDRSDIPHCLTGPGPGLIPEYPRNCLLGLRWGAVDECDETWDLPAEPRLCMRGGSIDLADAWCNGEAPKQMCVEMVDWDDDGDVDLRDVARVEVWFSEQE